MNLHETIKNLLTVDAVIDRCLLQGLPDAPLNPTEPVHIVTINGTELSGNEKGICTIGFIKSQLQRKRQLIDILQTHLKHE